MFAYCSVTELPFLSAHGTVLLHLLSSQPLHNTGGMWKWGGGGGGGGGGGEWHWGRRIIILLPVLGSTNMRQQL